MTISLFPLFAEPRFKHLHQDGLNTYLIKTLMRNTFLRDCDNRLIMREIYKNWEYQNNRKTKGNCFKKVTKEGTITNK